MLMQIEVTEQLAEDPTVREYLMARREALLQELSRLEDLLHLARTKESTHKKRVAETGTCTMNNGSFR